MIISYDNFGESWVLFSYYFITAFYKEPCKIRVYVPPTYTYIHTLCLFYLFSVILKVELNTLCMMSKCSTAKLLKMFNIF